VAQEGEGDKIVAFCNRRCDVIAPFVSASGNHSESPLLRKALPEVMRIARMAGFNFQGSIVSLDGVYDCRSNREAIFNPGMIPNINPNPRGRERSKRDRKGLCCTEAGIESTRAQLPDAIYYLSNTNIVRASERTPLRYLSQGWL